MKSYLDFRLVRSTGKTLIWSVNSGRNQLGLIKWHAPWRRYTLQPNGLTAWDRNCLAEVIEFINTEMAKRTEAAA